MEKEDKKKLLEEKNIHFWFVGSPVSLQSMKLELDMNVGAIFAYAKFLNVQPENISRMVCDIICYDSLRNQIDVLENCVYEGFDIERNKDFGSQIPFKIKNQQTRNIEFVIRSVTTTSGQTWNNRELKRFNMSLIQESIFNVQADLHQQFIQNCGEIDFDHTKLSFHPKFEEKYWLCACGCLNWSDEHTCCSCGIQKEWLMQNVDHEFLNAQNEERISETKRLAAQAQERERIDKERQKEEFQKRKEAYQKQIKKSESKKKIGKILPVVLILIIVVGGGFAGVVYGIPYINYRSAMSDFENRDYDGAKAKFEKLKDYSDSSEMVFKCTYEKAESYSESGSYKAAAEMFQSISGYFDADDKYTENMKLYADKLYRDAQFVDAAKIFRDIEQTDAANYKNALKKIYDEAEKQLKNAYYKKAYEKYLFLKDYKDSPEKTKQCLYHIASVDYLKLDYKSALSKFETLKGYKDVDKKLKQYSVLKKLISAVGEDGSPSVWNVYDGKCTKCGEKAEYILEFSDSGFYTFTVDCGSDGKIVVREGRFKVEDNILYDAEYVDGIMHFKKMADIKKVIDNASDKEGKNIAVVMTDPVNSKNKSEIKMYGNVISDENVSLG